MTVSSRPRWITLLLWVALVTSILCWPLAGYSPWSCLLTVPLLAPLPGMLRGQRYTYAWSTLLAVPYLALALTEVLVKPQSRLVASCTLLLVFAWFCALVMYLRISRARHE